VTDIESLFRDIYLRKDIIQTKECSSNEEVNVDI
jgi:hypothetical protein